MTSAKSVCQRGEMEEHVSRSPGFHHSDKCRKHSVRWHCEPAERGPSCARALQLRASPGHPPCAAPGLPGCCGRQCGVVWAAAAGQRVLLPETGPPQLQADVGGAERGVHVLWEGAECLDPLDLPPADCA